MKNVNLYRTIYLYFFEENAGKQTDKITIRTIVPFIGNDI